MDPDIVRRVSRALALALTLASPASAGTKHGFARAVFTYTYHPDVPMERFAAGAIGLPEPAHARIYLFAVYRALEGRPLSAAEQREWMKVWRLRSGHEEPLGSEPERWQDVRAGVPVAISPAQKQAAPVSQRNYTSGYVCSEDAFDRAALTLKERIRRFGKASAEVKFWTEGQDRVFRFCSDPGAEMPVAAPDTMPPLIRADRDYQVAAALFYGQRFDEAIEAFRRIATDRQSPWRTWAPYLMGRCLLWKARQTQSEKLYAQALARAEAQFRQVLRDPALAVTHESALYLLFRCMMISDRRAALTRLGEILDRGGWKAPLLLLYLQGLDWFDGYGWEPKSKPSRSEWPKDGLSQWMLAFRYDVDPAYGTIQWEQSQSRAWLYAALYRGNVRTPARAIEAAFEAPANPVGHALRYGAARTLLAQGQLERARAATVELSAAMNPFPSAFNRIEQLALIMKTEAADFLRKVPRRVIFAGDEQDSSEWWPHDQIKRRWGDSDAKYVAEAARLKALPRFDAVACDILNHRTPLRMLAAMVKQNALPKHLQDELNLATWLRAVLLGRWQIAAELAPGVARAFPAATGPVKEFVAKPNGETAALVLIRLPGARPYVSVGYGRTLLFTEYDEFGRNWWFRYTNEEMYAIDAPYFERQLRERDFVFARPAFVTAEEEAEAKREFTELRSVSEHGREWIALRLVTFVKRNPRRPDAAELLYRVLESLPASPWPIAELYDRPRAGIRQARDLLATQYKSSKWYGQYQHLDQFNTERYLR